jgi:hypothetical protein
LIAFYHRRSFGIVALLMWIASLALPIETDCGEPHASQGYVIFATGWLGAVAGQFGWFANPFMLWVMGRLLYDRRPGIIPAVIGLGLALTALTWKTSPRGDAPGVSTICEWHVGFYLWIACAVLLAVVALAEFAMQIKAKLAGGTP